MVSIEKRVHPIPFRTRKLSASSPMILRTFTWESRPMPRLSLERLLFRSLSSFKACACRICFEGRKIRSGFSSFFVLISSMAEAAEESGKENFLSGWPAGGSFRRQSENSLQHGKRLKRKIPRRQAAAGPVGERFQRNTESPPSTSATSGFSVWKDACFCSPPARHGRVYFQKENSRSGGAGWRK